MRYFLLLSTVLLGFACNSNSSSSAEISTSTSTTLPAPDAISLFGDSLYVSPPSEALMARYEARKSDYMQDSTDADRLIWHGRFTAYIGDYDEAIKIYSRGIERFPNDARMYRHRGHRYITIRKFDEAIADFQKAASLIQGTENEVEPDGMPNARNIPVSTLHGNIYYHLGLAYYLKQDMPAALEAYQKCLASSNNNDNIVSSTHWLYMISRRMDQPKQANGYLEAISDTMDIIENMAYHKACLFYKGQLKESDLMNESGNAPANDAIAYALANWYNYNEQAAEAEAAYTSLLQRGGWNSFGYIAAEADYFHMFKN